MTDLETLKDAFKKMGVHFQEGREPDDDGGFWTYLVPCSEDEVDHAIDLISNNFWEFDPDGKLASYG